MIDNTYYLKKSKGKHFNGILDHIPDHLKPRKIIDPYIDILEPYIDDRTYNCMEYMNIPNKTKCNNFGGILFGMFKHIIGIFMIHKYIPKHNKKI